jgi:hypothetical protein
MEMTRILSTPRTSSRPISSDNKAMASDIINTIHGDESAKLLPAPKDEVYNIIFSVYMQ